MDRYPYVCRRTAPEGGNCTRALITEPGLYNMNEPLSSLDGTDTGRDSSSAKKNYTKKTADDDSCLSLATSYG